MKFILVIPPSLDDVEDDDDEKQPETQETEMVFSYAATFFAYLETLPSNPATKSFYQGCFSQTQ